MRNLKLRPCIIVLTIVAVGIGLVLFFKRAEIANTINHSRSNRHLEKAILALDAKDLESFQRLCQAALQLNPSNLEALRAMLEYSALEKQNQVLNYSARVFAHPESTKKDKARSLAVFLEAKDYRLFAKYYSGLSETEKRQPDFLYLEAGFYASQGDAVGAMNILKRGPESDIRFLALKLALLSIATDEALRIQGQRELANLISSPNSNVANLAFQQIQSIPVELRELEILKPALDQWRQKRSNIRPSDQLVLDTFEWLSTSGPGSKVLQAQIVERVMSELGPDHPLLVVNWLIELQQWDEALDFSTHALNEALKDDDSLLAGEMFNAQLRTLRESNRWEELIDVLASPPVAQHPVSVALSRATAAKHLGKTIEFSNQIQEAWDHAELTKSQRNSFVDIYRWARRSDEPELAVKAMVDATKSGMGVLPPTDELTQFLVYLASNGLDAELISTTNGLFQREFFDTALVNNSLYLRELTNNPVTNGVAIAKQLQKSAPSTVGIKTTLILTHINREQYAEALALADYITSHHMVQELTPAETLIIAGAYRQAGKKHFAAERDLEKNLAAVMDIERRVFEKWFEE